MTSKEALSDLYFLAIGEQEHISKCKETIEQDLERLEKLEKTIELLKARVKMLETYHEPRSRYYHLFIGGRVVLLSREEYELLKVVLENE